MYCETCQADVAAEISPSGQALLCTDCGSEVTQTQAPALSDEARSARDLLQRWSQDEMLDPYGPVESATEESAPERRLRVDASTDGVPEPASSRKDQANRKVRRPNHPKKADPEPSEPTADSSRPASSGRGQSGPRKPHFRIDAGHGSRPDAPAADADPVDADPVHSEAVDADAYEPAAYALDAIAPAIASGPAPLPAGYRVDAVHQATPAPHMPLDAFAPPTGPRPGRFESLAGQLLAYGGVALLTVGTALILFGYFGGGEVASYTATGWLVATIGQMLLFLGVVTLISGGMQQTTHEVGSRVQYLGERLVRLESGHSDPIGRPHSLSGRTPARVTDNAASDRGELGR